MNAGEFKVWFECFTEAIGESPTRGQWESVKRRVEELKPDSLEPDLAKWINPYPEQSVKQVLDTLRSFEEQPLKVERIPNAAEVANHPSWYHKEWPQGKVACPVGTPAGIPAWADTWPDGSPRLKIP